MTDTTVKFGLLVSMFQAMLRDRTAAKKRKRFRTFLDRVYTGREYFSAVRLILPGLDRERGTYGLKESTLATCVVDALGLAKDSPDALRLVNWRKGGARSGANAGNFALIAAEVLQRRQGMVSGGLTIRELNNLLDQLASTENRGEKAVILSSLIKKTNALEMKWILMIILKDLKLGISEKSIFHEFHPDAEDLFNVTCDLKLVCEKLKDHTQRQKKQDIEVGKPVRPQLAMRVGDATTAWKKLHGKHVVVECKFDGDRIQIHKNGEEIHFFSRNFLEHPEYAHGMSNVIVQNILVQRCILDGEMLVWDMATQHFAEFGSNQEIAKAAKEGLESNRQLCYIAFDILYVGDTSVIHQSLTERHSLLQKVVKPVKGRLEILVPDGGINDHRPPGQPFWSTVAYNVEDVERFFKDTIENRDEGIVLKDLGSKWEPGDRSGKWLKLKPDYIHAGSDLDVLIIGGYFGSGRRGGEVSQFLVGLAELSDHTSYPKRFISFCRVGSGLSNDELNALVAKLKPYFRKNEYPKRVPHFYEVTNNSKERPDVWIESPDKSIVISITSDIRTVKSEVFAAPYGLRFPRITRVRYDKPWYECLDVQSFIELVQSSNGNTRRADDAGLQNENPKHTRNTRRGERKKVTVVPAHFIQTDTSDVREETFIFANMVFYFVNIPPSYSVDYFHKVVVENGGTFSMNLNDSVTHCIAAEKKAGIKYQAAVHHGDVIHYSWVLDCCKQKRLLHLQPKYFLFFAGPSRKKILEEFDAFSDHYYWDLDVTDIKQIFSNIVGLESSDRVEYYRKKYCPVESLCLFRGCCIYFFKALPIINTDCKEVSELALRRMRLEITMHAGEVCDSLTRATHLLVYSTNESYNFDHLYKSFPLIHRHLLHSKKLHIVRYQWLEDSVKKAKKLPEDPYNLNPDSLEDLEVDNSEHGLPASTSNMENQSVSTLLDKYETGKRARPIQRNTGKGNPRSTRRMRARIGNRPAKIDREESVSSDSAVVTGREEALESRKYNNIMGEGESANDNTRIEGESAKTCESLGGTLVWGQTGSEDMHPAELHKKKDSDVGSDSMHVIEDRLGEGEKLEQMVDPLHAMLLDMVPSLSQRNVEGESCSLGGEKQQQQDINANPVKKVDGEKEKLNVDANPVKKKVSYKDVAGQLLEDW
uniref:DNA ligase n=4 Tax=Musa acuminata subsp. malaccensis TaxID=214687 RepID=A0A804HVQ9_MUSAM|nr:PREDICTED: DNA ligase 4 isoform X1 [Musa acuminata subsp. malaccensis]